MKVEFTKVTWYSRIATYVVFLIIIPILAIHIFNQYEKTFNILGTQDTNSNY